MTPPANQMVSLRIYYSFCCNFPPAKKYELAGRALTKNSNTNTPIPAIFCAPNPVFTPALALFENIYTNIDLQKATKLALDLFI